MTDPENIITDIPANFVEVKKKHTMCNRQNAGIVPRMK